MSKRKWTNIRSLESELLYLREMGKSKREIADALGLEMVQIKNWINRYNRQQARIEAGLPPNRRGRPPKGVPESIEEYKFENQRLKMENKLLRDFLQSTGRK